MVNVICQIKPHKDSNIKISSNKKLQIHSDSKDLYKYTYETLNIFIICICILCIYQIINFMAYMIDNITTKTNTRIHFILQFITNSYPIIM